MQQRIDAAAPEQALPEWCHPAPTRPENRRVVFAATAGRGSKNTKHGPELLPQRYEASSGDRYASLLVVFRAFRCAFWESARPNTAAQWLCWGRCLRTHMRGAGWCAGTPGSSQGTACGCLLHACVQLVYALHRPYTIGAWAAWHALPLQHAAYVAPDESTMQPFPCLCGGHGATEFKFYPPPLTESNSNSNPVQQIHTPKI